MAMIGYSSRETRTCVPDRLPLPRRDYLARSAPAACWSLSQPSACASRRQRQSAGTIRRALPISTERSAPLLIHRSMVRVDMCDMNAASRIVRSLGRCCGASMPPRQQVALDRSSPPTKAATRRHHHAGSRSAPVQTRATATAQRLRLRRDRVGRRHEIGRLDEAVRAPLAIQGRDDPTLGQAQLARLVRRPSPPAAALLAWCHPRTTLCAAGGDPRCLGRPGGCPLPWRLRGP